MPTHRNNRLDIFGDGAEVEKLYNDRWRVTVRCLPQDKVKDWFYENRGNTFANFASSMDAEIKIDGASQGWGAPDGQPWADAKLISQSLGYTPSGEYVVTFTYETLPTEYLQDRSEEVDYELNGLRRVTRTLIAEEGSDYGKVVGSDSIEHTALGYGTETLYLATVNELPKPDDAGGYTRIQEVWLQPGILSESVRQEDGGLESVSVRSWYEKPQFTNGVIESVIQENVEGFNVWTATAKRKPDGSSITDGVAQQYDGYFDFQYPGVASIYEKDVNYPGVQVKFLGVDLQPPITTPILATVTVKYFTGISSPSLQEDLWNPSSWAKVDATWINTSNQPRSKQEGLRGYRVGSPASISYTSTSLRLGAPFNEFTPVSNETEIEITGGPEDPSGNTYVINSPKPEFAFSDENGEDYYRWVEIIATVP